VWVGITLVIVFLEILLCCFQNYWFPLLYFLAFSPLLLGAIARALMLIGVIEKKILGGWGSLIGALFQAILMSLFLANHINSLKKQKASSDEESLKNIQKNHKIEQEFIIQLQEDSKSLEDEVESRAKELRKKNDQMKEELQMAVEIQQFMLPEKIEMDFLKSGLLYLPHSKVSGDIYRFSKTREDQFRLFLGDATGHGVSAAFITMMVQMALSSLRTNRTSIEVIQKLNKLLAMCIPDDKFMTGVFLEVSSKGWLQSCSAGHPPIIIFSKGKKPVIVEEQSHGMPLGMFGEEIVPYTEWTFQLSEGDLFIVYTDGITEYENQQQEQFGEERLIQFIEEKRGIALKLLTQELHQTLKDFSGCEPNDDITLIAFEFQPNDKL
jgi:sigma-B regulation protein RsbU (phosphoserine phosphatase)